MVGSSLGNFQDTSNDKTYSHRGVHTDLKEVLRNCHKRNSRCDKLTIMIGLISGKVALVKLKSDICSNQEDDGICRSIKFLEKDELTLLKIDLVSSLVFDTV